MGYLRSAVVILLVGLLAVDLVAANALVAIDRTALNPDFVTTTLAEEGAYEQAEPIVLEQLPTEELEGNESPPLPVDPKAVASAALDADYLQSQIEPNIERAYAYLHGNADELELVVDLEPAKTAIADAVEAELTDASAAELLGTVGGDEGTLSFEAGGTSIDLATVADMAEDESVFRAERRALRAELRDRVLDGLVDEAFAEATNDQLLGHVIEDYDPDRYTDAEKQQLVDDHEAEIRSALRDRIEAESGGEIDAAVDEQLAETREAIRANVTRSMDENLEAVDPAVAGPATDLVLVAVDGYVADASHDEFSSAFEAAADDLAAGVATLLESELDENVPDRIDLAEQLEPSARENLVEVRRVVGIIDLLAAVLPVVGVALAALVYLVSRSLAVTAAGAGAGLVIGGLPTLLGASQAPGRLREVFAGGGMPAAIEELVLAMAGQLADAVFVQSAVVVGAGVVLLGAGLALQFGLVELPSGTDRD